MKKIMLVFVVMLLYSFVGKAQIILYNPSASKQIIPYNQSASIESFNYRNEFIRHKNLLGYKSKIVTELDKKDASFFIVYGLSRLDDGYISFESDNVKDFFLRHQNSSLKISKLDNTDLFLKDATFKVVRGLADKSWVSFESVNFPGCYIRHKNGKLLIEKNNKSELFKKDATWRFTAPKY